MFPRSLCPTPPPPLSSSPPPPHRAQSLADAVPTILTWMAKSHPPGASHIKTGTYTADSPATAQRPANVRHTAQGQNPGGGMGVMAPGRFTLEMFQKEVPLRDF